MKRNHTSPIVVAAVALGAAMGANAQYVALAGFRTTGDLDTTFGNNGRNVLSFPGTATGMALDSKGRIVVVGTGSGPQIVVARYQYGGKSIDASFGTNGVTITSIPGGARGRGVAIAAGDTIVVAGGMNGGFGILRFSEAGIQQTPMNCPSVTPSDWSGEAYALTIASGGRIVAAGTNPGSSRFLVARFTADGCKDPSFVWGLGINSFDASPSAQQKYEAGKAVAIDGSGRILVAGPLWLSSEGGAGVSIAVVRFFDNGLVDSSYGPAGFANCLLDSTLTPGNFEDAANSIAIHNGHASVAGFYQGGRLVRFDANGSMLYLMNAAVSPKSLIPSYDASALLVGGWKGSKKFGVAEFNFNGTLVPSFGNSGVAAVDADCTMSNYVAGIANQFVGTTFGWWRTVAAGPSGPNGCPN